MCTLRRLLGRKWLLRRLLSVYGHDMHECLRALIYGGSIKSAHDCSEGGLLVAIAESCISNQSARHTPNLIGATVDLSAAKDARVDALLFGETQSRIVISTSTIDAGKVLAQAKALKVPAIRLGTVGGDKLIVKAAPGEWSWALSELHDSWFNSIARLMA